MPAEDWDFSNVLTLEEILKDVVLEWEGACLDGRVAAAHHMMDMIPEEMLEYIESTYPHCLEEWAVQCGITKGKTPHLRPRRGDVIESIEHGYRFLVLGSSLDEARYSLVRPPGSVMSVGKEWAVLLPVKGVPSDLRVAGAIAWESEDHFEFYRKVED